MSALTNEQADLRDSVRSLLSRRSDSAAVRRAIAGPDGFDRDLWTALCTQIGVAALAIPESYGGLGAGPVECHVVLEELGRTLTPSPMLGSAVLAAQALLGLADEQASARLLPSIADASSVVALCWGGPSGRWDACGGSIEWDGARLSGRAELVLDGKIADTLLVAARAGDELAVFEVPGGAARVRRLSPETLDPTRRLATVSFDGVPASRIGQGDATAVLSRARERACIALTAEQVGGAARILELTVAYAKVREQFGRPIGSFQALKHRLADLHVLVEAARSASYAAATGALSAAVAKTYCSEAFFTVAAEAIQLHGGIAITWEHDAHLYLKRAHGSSQLFGTPGEHLLHIAALAGLEEAR